MPDPHGPGWTILDAVVLVSGENTSVIPTFRGGCKGQVKLEDINLFIT